MSALEKRASDLTDRYGRILAASDVGPKRNGGFRATRNETGHSAGSVNRQSVTQTVRRNPTRFYSPQTGDSFVLD
jgi:hypothetical protein